MDLIVADDAEKKKPLRPGMNSMLAIGGIHVPSEQVVPLERELGAMCREVGFPENQEFKWSPGRRDWMRDGLVEENRSTFFRGCLDAGARAGVTVIVAMVDAKRGMAETSSDSHEEDVVTLFLERANNHLEDERADAVVIADRPGGSRKQENKFVGRCIETLREGTGFVKFERIGFVITGDSRHARLLQLADLVTSCTASYVCGQPEHHTKLFLEKVLPLMRSDSSIYGGYGLKLHPDYTYANLYHWLLGDEYLGRVGKPLPAAGRPYAGSADEF
jgi:hypothetical protein